MTAVATSGLPWGQSIVKRCAEGEADAWGDLYRTYAPVARRFLARMGVDSEALDDVCQEVFLQAFRYLPGFRGECSFQTWLYRICATEARRTRKRNRMLKLVSFWLHTEHDFAQTNIELSSARATHLVEGALSHLDEAERLVFVLYELEGLQGRQIAEIVDSPEATVFRRLHYARKKFRQHVENNGVAS